MPLLIIILSICLEYVPELFIHIPFKYKVPDTSGYEFDTTYKDAVWYFIHSLLMLTCIMYIFILIPRQWVALKLLTISSFSWWVIEFYQKFCWLAKINDNRLYVNDDSRWQIFITLSLVLGGIYGLIRFKS